MNKQKFTIVFEDHNGVVTSKMIEGEMMHVNEIIQAFIDTYQASGYGNQIEVTINGLFEGTKHFKSHPWK